MSIAELSLKRPVSTIMFFISLMVIGAIAAVRLPLEFFPAVDAPFVFVNIPYPGSTPAEIERTITRPPAPMLTPMRMPVTAVMRTAMMPMVTTTTATASPRCRRRRCAT